MVACLFIGGCMKSQDESGQTTYKLDPNAVAGAETGAEATISILAILSAFIPALVPVVSVAGGVVATWLKMKPKLQGEKTRADIAYSVAESAVDAIEEFKKDNPAKWVELKEKYFTGVIGLEAENVIRAIRDLPKKEKLPVI